MGFSAVLIDHPPPALEDDAAAAQDALLRLQAQAARHHRERGVRGLTVCGPGYVVRWLQGEEARVRALIDELAHDSSRGRPDLVFAGEAPEPLDAWSTTLLAPAGADARQARFLDELRAGSVPDAGPGAIVRRLLDPGPPEPACQRVGLFGQSGTWPGALLDGLQARWPSAMRRRCRLLGSVGLEREPFIEHLDHDTPDQGAVQVLNLSGELLAASWMRGRIAPLRVAALFFTGSTQESVTAFAESMAGQLAAANARTPLVCFFGRTAARFAPAVQAALETLGRTARMSDVPVTDTQAVWRDLALSLQPRASAPAAEDRPPCEAPFWLERLLAIEGVAAAGILDAAGAAAPCLRVRAGSPAARLSSEFEAWSETVSPTIAQGREPVQWLVRWQDRLTLLQSLPSQDTTVFIASEEGFTNESWLRLEVGRVLQDAAQPVSALTGPGPG